jgi:hypothetical protein
MLLTGAIVLIVSVVVFFAWSNVETRRTHASSTREDVRYAVENCLGLNDHHHDAWDLFLAWPIDDPYLESVRQRCLRVWDEHGPEPVGARLRQELEEILRELQAP